ncbi:hypothetical protein LTR85_000904 [Meristemomyces frigidus]|nr:hypothetical protein LTR85_000904 [Meristemomyces frigidus]
MVDDIEDGDVPMEAAYDSEDFDEDAGAEPLGDVVNGEDLGDYSTFHNSEEDDSRYQSPYASQPPGQNATPDAPSPHTGTSDSPAPGETVSRYGNPYAPRQKGAQVNSSLLQMPYFTTDQVHASTTTSRRASLSQSSSKGTTPAASASPTNEHEAPAVDPEPEPTLADAIKVAEAQQFWSKTANLGFGTGSQRNRYEDFDGFQADTTIAGAPMANEFYQSDGALDRASHVPDLDELSLDGVRSAAPTRRASTRGRGSTRGTPGERGRGRPRGWKWAVAGTAHDTSQSSTRGAKRGRPRGSGEGRGQGRPRGPRKDVDPGQEFKRFQTEATTAFMDGDFETALQAARQAVQANPEVYAAHSLLSNILLRMGRTEDALAALMSGANTKRDPELWNLVAQRTLELAGDERTDYHRGQALFAYSHALKYAPKDENNGYVARAGKRDMYIELGDWNEARNLSKGMLRLRPADLDNVRTFAELCAETKEPLEYHRAKEAYEAAFTLFEDKETLGDPDDQWSHVNIYLETVDRLGSTDRIAGFVDHINIARDAISMLRRLARRILGRKEETFWDSYIDDDREYDSGQDRRGLVGEFQQGRASRDRERYGDGLPLEIRVKLGIFRVKMGMLHHQEGLSHLDHLLRLSDEVEQYYDLFLHVAETLRTCRLWEPALKFYDAIKAGLEVTDETFFMGSAQCYVESGRHGEAEDIYRSLIKAHPEHVHARVQLAKMYEKIGWKEQALPLIKQVMKLGRKDAVIRANLLPRHHQRPVKQLMPKANGPVHQPTQQAILPRAGGPRALYGTTSLGLPQSAVQYAARVSSLGPSGLPSPVPSRRNDKERVEERLQRMKIQGQSIELHHRVVQQHWPAIEGDGDEAAVRKWTESASTMVSAFREMDIFYPLGKQARTRNLRFTGYVSREKGYRNQLDSTEQTVNAMFDRLQSAGNEGADGEDTDGTPQARALDPSVPRDFHGIPFIEWHRIFVDLALLYAKSADQDRCYDVLKNGLFRANVFSYDEVLHNTSLAAGLCCALMFNDSDFVTDIGRRYIQNGDSRPAMPCQLLAAGNRLCYGDIWSVMGQTQKNMARLVTTMDHILLPEEVRSKVDYGKQNAASLNHRLERLGQGNGELDAGVLLLYGSMLMHTHTGATPALCCYLRALALQPDNFSVNLIVGVSYIQCAMRNKSDNRQYGIQQGLSFLCRYYELRTASGKAGHLQEAEYNMAKTWHMLGLTHLAVPGYEKVLALSETVQADRDAEAEDEVEDFAKEAAFALQQMFALVGNDEAARAITEQWLVL